MTHRSRVLTNSFRIRSSEVGVPYLRGREGNQCSLRTRATLLASFVLFGVYAFLIAATATGETYKIPAEGFEVALQDRLASAHPGDTIVLPAGNFSLSRSLTLAVSRVTVRGKGRKKTRLDFSNQKTGAQSWLVMGKEIEISGLTIVDSPADGLVARDSSGLRIRDVGVEWTQARAATSGGYGLYPVMSTNVTIENCYARGASEAGIYVGQTVEGVVRKNVVEGNVVGLDIENSLRIKIEDNVVRGNSIGVLVSARPGLFQPRSVGNQLIGNEITDNNLSNFAAEGSYIAGLGEGRGIVVIASGETSIAKNTMRGHQSSQMLFLNFASLGLEWESDLFFVADLERTRLVDNEFLAEPRPAAIRSARWQEARGFDLVWDGRFSLQRYGSASAPKPLCRMGPLSAVLLNVSDPESAQGSGVAIPDCGT